MSLLLFLMGVRLRLVRSEEPCLPAAMGQKPVQEVIMGISVILLTRLAGKAGGIQSPPAKIPVPGEILKATTHQPAGRGRPPQAAARRAGLEFVEKLLTSAVVALLDEAEREHASARVPLPAATGRPGYWLSSSSSWSWCSAYRRLG
jgi:hypothetical protein